MKNGVADRIRGPIAAAFALVAFSAQAADIYAPQGSLKDAPVYAPPMWTGFYLGVNGGYAWGAQPSLRAFAYEDGDDFTSAASAKISPEGGFGGGQIGYNLQQDRLVFGIEADIQGSNINGKGHAQAVSEDTDVVTNAWAKTSLDWFGSLRGRIGYAFGGTMLYATGGLAFGGVKDTLSQSVNSINAEGPFANSASKSSTLTGYAVGGGVETFITPSWTLKAEYQYIDLGSTRLSTNNDIAYDCEGPCTDNGHAVLRVDHAYNTVRVGLNYKFNQPYEPLK